MTAHVAKVDSAAILERVIIGGNLAELTPTERLRYYQAVCESVGLNPLTKPFDYLQLSGRLVLYAKKEATDQLRKIHGVSITKLEREMSEGVYCVTAYATDRTGRTDSSLGAVTIDQLRGEAKANGLMKAESKAKRRVTLSICGLGIMDESEIEDALLADMSRDTQTKQPETVVTCKADVVTPEEEERTSLLKEATRISKGLSVKEKRAYMLEHLGSEQADILTADPAALRAMVDDMKKKASQKREDSDLYDRG
jgi:hypothetical protein